MLEFYAHMHGLKDFVELQIREKTVCVTKLSTGLLSKNT